MHHPMQYLKEQRVGTATFLPLSSLKVKPIHERLRNQLATSKSAKLIIDLLKFDSRIQKAVLYAVGNTVYCDTLDEAKTLAFDRAQPLRSTPQFFFSFKARTIPTNTGLGCGVY